ncbi:MAG: FtsX-like permease family protein [Actinobacteria bacterium]|nr:FtsX-like permease family protein [Actinomycetota bacterium]
MAAPTLVDLYREADDPNHVINRPRPLPLRLLTNAPHLYRLRVRHQPLQELLALVGIAAGVALLFAVQVATSSITGSLEKLAHGVTGDASLEIAARGPSGMDQALVTKARALPEVAAAAPLIERRITIQGPRGKAPLTLVGVDQRLERIGGPLVRRFIAKRGNINSLGLYLTSETAAQIGVKAGDSLTIESGATKRSEILAGVLGSREIGDLTKSPVALAPLGQAQRIAQMSGHISRVLIKPAPGHKAQATAALSRLTSDHSDVRPSDSEVKLLGRAIQADQRSSVIFGALAVVIGLLFAYNAILLSMAFRRRFIGYLRLIGADRATVLATLVFEALLLGLVASFVGMVLGDLLLHVAFGSYPRYLSAGFTIGDQRFVTLQTVGIALAGGMMATGAALAIPAIELFRVHAGTGLRPVAARERPLTRRGFVAALLSGAFIAAAAGTIALLAPVLTPACIALVVVGVVVVVGPLTNAAFRLIRRATRRRSPAWLSLAVDELAGARRRMTAMALIAAGATFAIVAIGGARLDVQRGTTELNQRFFAGAELWIFRDGTDNAFMTERFDPAPTLTKLRKIEMVGAVDELHGVFEDLGGYRVLIAARPRILPTRIASRIVRGDVISANKRITAGDWIAVDDLIARRNGAGPGDWFALPTPTGIKRYRIAATITNFGWPSGAIAMNGRDFSRAWADDKVGALAVDLKAGADPTVARRQIQNALGFSSALNVVTPEQAIDERVAIGTQGMGRLRQVATLTLFAAVLAIVAAMFAAVWQQRAWLASLRAIGMVSRDLFKLLLTQTTLVVLLGGLIGLVFGVYSQLFASRWIEYSSGFHAPYKPALAFGLLTLAKAVALATLATAVPAFLASRVRPRVGEAVL